MTSEKDRCFEIGFDDYIAKPVKGNVLMNKIKRLVKVEKAH